LPCCPSREKSRIKINRNQACRRRCAKSYRDIHIFGFQSQTFDFIIFIIATNIPVYYDVFEQSLALANIESMLRDCWFLLSNSALLELPVGKMNSVDYLTGVYSDRREDGDHIVWYQGPPEPW
jgi:hypothetical protein